MTLSEFLLNSWRALGSQFFEELACEKPDYESSLIREVGKLLDQSETFTRKNRDQLSREWERQLGLSLYQEHLASTITHLREFLVLTQRKNNYIGQKILFFLDRIPHLAPMNYSVYERLTFGSLRITPFEALEQWLATLNDQELWDRMAESLLEETERNETIGLFPSSPGSLAKLAEDITAEDGVPLSDLFLSLVTPYALNLDLSSRPLLVPLTLENPEKIVILIITVENFYE